MELKKSLYVIQNIFIFLEECFVKEPANSDYYTFNPLYVKDKKTHEKLTDYVKTLYPELHYIDFDAAAKETWECIYISSYFANKLNELNKFICEEMILVEDGLFDYIPNMENYSLYNGKKVYLFKPDSASKLAKQGEVLPLYKKPEVTDKFFKLFNKEISKFNNLDKKLPILFTSPLEEDFNATAKDMQKLVTYLEDKYSGQTIILKKHPRDTFIYKSDKIKFIDCDKNVPGQIIDKMFTGEKIYLFPSTVSFMSGADAKITYINALPLNDEYNKVFVNISKSEILNNKNIMIKQIM